MIPVRWKGESLLGQRVSHLGFSGIQINPSDYLNRDGEQSLNRKLDLYLNKQVCL